MPSIRDQLQPKKVETPTQPQQPLEAPNSAHKPKPFNVKVNFGKPETHQATKEALTSLFPGKSLGSIAKAAGVPHGSEVTFTSHNPGEIQLDATHPNGYMQRSYENTPNGLKLNHLYQTGESDSRGQGAEKFAEQAKAASELGVKSISALGLSDEKHHGGYSVPRLGFNNNLSARLYSSLSPELQSKIDASGKRDYHTLFKVGGGEELKQKHSTTDSLDFDLTPNSDHWNHLNDYLAQRRLGSSATTPASPVATEASSGVSANPQTTPTTGTRTPSGLPHQTTPTASKFSRSNEKVPSTSSSNRQRIKRAVAKFARANVNPLVAGTHLEHALKNIQQTATSPNSKQFATAALGAAPEGVTDHEHLADNLHFLHSSLVNERHPLAYQYNWPRAAAGLHLDNAIHHAADAVGKQYPKLTPQTARTNGLIEMFNHHIGDSEGASQKAKEAIDTVKEHSGADDEQIKDSMERLFYNYHTKKHNPDLLRIHANNPDMADIAPTTSKALRFSRPVAAIDLASAAQRVNSRLGDTLQQLAKTIYTKLKLEPVTVKKAIHSDDTGSTASTIHTVVHDDPDTVTSAAAHYGLLTETPSMAVFREGEGPDSLHHFKVHGSGDRLRSKLSELGIDQAVLSPDKTGYHVYILDPNSSQTPLVSNAAKQLGSHLTTVRGLHEMVGEGDEVKADKESRRNYRSVINSTGAANG